MKKYEQHIGKRVITNDNYKAPIKIIKKKVNNTIGKNGENVTFLLYGAGFGTKICIMPKNMLKHGECH